MIDIIAGEVPKDINGVYLRNGPNPKFFPKNNRHHAFDGDSMIHAIRLKQGKINYCNKMTRTPKFLQELDAGKALTVRAGELFNGSGMMKAILYAVQEAIGYSIQNHRYKRGVANTAFCQYGDKTYALLEADYPFNIKVDTEKENLDILSIGHDDFEG